MFRAFVTVPFVLPTVVVATAFLVLFRPGGALAFLGWQRGVAPLVVAEVFFNIAVVVRTIGGFWSQLDPRRVDAARVLGASGWAFGCDAVALGADARQHLIVFLFTFTALGSSCSSLTRATRGGDLPPGVRLLRSPTARAVAPCRWPVTLPRGWRL